MGRAPRIAIIAGEASGDHLGGPLISELQSRFEGQAEFTGIGGEDMVARGMVTLFPMSEIAVMGPLAILRRLPSLLRRIQQAAQSIVDWQPDVMVIIDCPEFSHRVASRVRAKLPDLPIIDYVAPSVWAWRPWRAKSMVRYIDDVMAVLPFEPDVFVRLKGPRCRYVGHSAGERLSSDPGLIADLKARIPNQGPLLVVMPGSRMNEINRLVEPFSEAVARLVAEEPSLGVIMPVLPHTRDVIQAATANWAVQPTIVTDEKERHAAMEAADAAIVASGTATLELALAGTPMVVGYKMEAITAWVFRPLVSVPSIVLANLIHGDNPVPELFQSQCSGQKLAEAVGPLLRDTPQRRAQVVALADITQKVRAPGKPPSAAAADIVVEAIERSFESGQNSVTIP